MKKEYANCQMKTWACHVPEWGLRGREGEMYADRPGANNGLIRFCKDGKEPNSYEAPTP